MANGTSAAVTEAARLDEIGFPEFTTKLITDVFDALVSANIRQTESYVELLSAVGKSLTAYINDTKDDIDGAQIMQFLAAVLPPADPEGESATKVEVGESLNAGEASALNTALALPGEETPDVATTGEITQTAFEAIMEAVAKRIAANKYDLLQEMVRQGILRLVVENGEIETRLTFTTYGSTFAANRSSDYSRKDFNFRAKAKTGFALSKWVNASASTSYNSVRVRTTTSEDRDTSGSQVQIYGGVKIRFKTDYLPLNQ
jgi:hypothetical protein